MRIWIVSLLAVLMAGPALAGWSTDTGYDGVVATGTNQKSKIALVVGCMAGKTGMVEPVIGVEFNRPKIEYYTETPVRLTIDKGDPIALVMDLKDGTDGYYWRADNVGEWAAIAQALMDARQSIKIDMDFKRIVDETLWVTVRGSHKAISPALKRCTGGE